MSVKKVIGIFLFLLLVVVAVSTEIKEKGLVKGLAYLLVLITSIFLLELFILWLLE